MDRALLASLQRIDHRLAALEQCLAASTTSLSAKEWLTVPEAARMLGKAPFTIRAHARDGRIRAKKKPCGRGPAGEWVIHLTEIARIQNEGLPPICRPAVNA